MSSETQTLCRLEKGYVWRCPAVVLCIALVLLFQTYVYLCLGCIDWSSLIQSITDAIGGFVTTAIWWLSATALHIPEAESFVLRNTMLSLWRLPASQDSNCNRGYPRVNSTSASSTTSFAAAKRFSEPGNALESFSFFLPFPNWLSFTLCSPATQGVIDSCCQIFCTQTCPFLALKTLMELTRGLELSLGTFNSVIGNDVFMPLLD